MSNIAAVPKDQQRSLECAGHIGFDSLPYQVVSKFLQNGSTFNIMCIGEPASGKSTLINTLFKTTFDEGGTPDSKSYLDNNFNINTYIVRESNVYLTLTITESIGFGEKKNILNSCRTAVDHIEAQYEAYLQEELKIKRSLSSYHDTRIHVCLYFLRPTGHGLTLLDIACLKQLHTKINIIPIIAKADLYSREKLRELKSNIFQELQANEIDIFKLPTLDDEDFNNNSCIVTNADLPLAVIGSSEYVRIEKRRSRGRQYPWGEVEIENSAPTDFMKLREMLLRTNMEDFREKTEMDYYESYREMRLQQMGFNDDNSSNLLELQRTYETKRLEQLANQQKKEDDLRARFVARVKAKEAELYNCEREYCKQMKQFKKIEAEESQKLEEMLQKFDNDYIEFLRLKARKLN